MLSPRVGGGDPGEFDIFTRARDKFPTPGHLENVKFPPLGTACCPKTGRSYVKFLTPGRNPNVKIPTQGKARRVNFPWVARPPTLGLNIDRCIMTIILIKIISFDLDQCQRYLGEKTVKPSWPAPNLLLICTRKD